MKEKEVSVGRKLGGDAEREDWHQRRWRKRQEREESDLMKCKRRRRKSKRQINGRK